MNPVAADVSPITYLWGSLSGLTSTLRSAATEDGSAATRADWFMVPMLAQRRKEAFHEPQGRAGLRRGEDTAPYQTARFTVNCASVIARGMNLSAGIRACSCINPHAGKDAGAPGAGMFLKPKRQSTLVVAIALSVSARAAEPSTPDESF